jgi:hypothetical protein
MEVLSETSEEFGGHYRIGNSRQHTEQWQRWDEEMVEQFGRWLVRIAIGLGVSFVLVFASAILAWF